MRGSAPGVPLGFSISRVSNFAEVPDMVFPSKLALILLNDEIGADMAVQLDKRRIILLLRCSRRCYRWQSISSLRRGVMVWFLTWRRSCWLRGSLVCQRPEARCSECREDLQEHFRSEAYGGMVIKVQPGIQRIMESYAIRLLMIVPFHHWLV